MPVPERHVKPPHHPMMPGNVLRNLPELHRIRAMQARRADLDRIRHGLRKSRLPEQHVRDGSAKSVSDRLYDPNRISFSCSPSRPKRRIDHRKQDRPSSCSRRPEHRRLEQHMSRPHCHRRVRRGSRQRVLPAPGKFPSRFAAARPQAHPVTACRTAPDSRRALSFQNPDPVLLYSSKSPSAPPTLMIRA